MHHLDDALGRVHVELHDVDLQQSDTEDCKWRMPKELFKIATRVQPAIPCIARILLRNFAEWREWRDSALFCIQGLVRVLLKERE